MDKQIAKLYDAGDTDRAIHLLIKKIDEHPQNIKYYLQLSTYLIEQGSFDQAQQLLQQALHLVSQPKELFYNLAVVYYMQGQFEQAINLLNQIPNDDLTLYQKALVYLRLGQPQKAVAYALTIKQKDKRVKELLGDIWLNLGQLTHAYQSYNSILDTQKTAKIYFLMGVTILTKNRKQADTYFAKAKQMNEKYYQKAWKQYAAILKTINGKEDKDD